VSPTAISAGQGFVMSFAEPYSTVIGFEVAIHNIKAFQVNRGRSSKETCIQRIYFILSIKSLSLYWLFGGQLYGL